MVRLSYILCLVQIIINDFIQRYDTNGKSPHFPSSAGNFKFAQLKEINCSFFCLQFFSAFKNRPTTKWMDNKIMFLSFFFCEMMSQIIGRKPFLVADRGIDKASTYRIITVRGLFIIIMAVMRYYFTHYPHTHTHRRVCVSVCNKQRQKGYWLVVWK